MRLGLGPGNREIYDLFGWAGENTAAIAALVSQRFQEYPNTSVLHQEVKDHELIGDQLVADLARSIRGQLITPFDPDDLLTLVFAIDDVADAIEHASALLGLYHMSGTDRASIQLCKLLVEATTQLASLLSRLKGLRGSADEIPAIKDIEDRADDVARAARASLFKNSRVDPMLVIRWKDIYEALEEAVDACETAADRVGNILVKHA